MIIRRTHLAPEHIGVVVCGYPSEAAMNVARECVARGFRVCKFGLATDEIKDEKLITVPDVGNVRLAKYSVPTDAKLKLELEILESQREGLFIVVADTTENVLNVEMYNDLSVPFVLQCKEAESLIRAIKHTEASKTFAVISGHMNKRLASFDVTWAEWSRRYAGMFDDFDFEFKSSSPLETPVSLMASFSELVNKDMGRHQITDLMEEDQTKMGYPPSHHTREFTFKSRGETSVFTFSQSVDDQEAYAEGIADSIAFLAQRAHRTSRPQVYNILDVAEQSPFLMSLST